MLPLRLESITGVIGNSRDGKDSMKELSSTFDTAYMECIILVDCGVVIPVTKADKSVDENTDIVFSR